MAEAHEGAGADCLIVGGGLSGLACAHLLAREGHTVQVLEAAEVVGGRSRTRFHHGEPVDVGFHALLAGFKETGQFLGDIGIAHGDVRPFERGVTVHDGRRWIRVRPGPDSLRRLGIAGYGESARAGATLARWAAAGDRHLGDTAGPDGRADLEASGLPPRLVELVLRPLLGGMVLDRAIGADAGYVRYLIATLARGGAGLPVDGIGMIGERAATALARAGGMIWTGVRVSAIEQDGDRVTGVTLEDGRRVAARNVVLATDARSARRLLAGIDDAAAARLPQEGRGVISAAFALRRPLYEGRTILLDAAGPEGNDRVDLVCQTTNITRPGSPGPHILVAQSATANWTDVDPDRYARVVGERVRAWSPKFDWERNAERIGTHVDDWALPHMPPGVRANLPGPRTAVGNLVLAGDAVMHPSIEGAVAAGRRAARVVRSLIS